MDRRRFMRLGAVGGAALLAGCNRSSGNAPGAAGKVTPPAAAPSAQPFDFQMNVLDGYAYLMSSGNTRLVLGGIDANGIEHPMFLSVRVGADRVVKGTIAKDPKGVYKLTGRHTVLELASQSTGLHYAQTATMPSPTVCLPNGDARWDNLRFIPDAHTLYPPAAYKLNSAWAAEVPSRFVLDRGTLAVQSGVLGVWHFHAVGQPDIIAQQMSDNVMIRHRSDGPAALLKVYGASTAEPDPSSQPTDIIELTPVLRDASDPASGRVTIELSTLIDPSTLPDYKEDEAVMHFGRYAKLFQTMDDKAVPQDAIVYPYFKKCTGTQLTPGFFCPLIRAVIS